MLNNLHSVLPVDCVKKYYILQIYCSTEVLKIVSGAKFVQFDDHCASNLQYKCVFIFTVQHVAQLDAFGLEVLLV